MFWRDFSTLLEYISAVSSHRIMVGDFNVCVDDKTNKEAKLFLDILDSANLNQHITEPTHQERHTIDLLILSKDEHIICDINIATSQLSDHHAVLYTLNFARPDTPKKRILCRKHNFVKKS